MWNQIEKDWEKNVDKQITCLWLQEIRSEKQPQGSSRRFLRYNDRSSQPHTHLKVKILEPGWMGWNWEVSRRLAWQMIWRGGGGVAIRIAITRLAAIFPHGLTTNWPIYCLLWWRWRWRCHGTSQPELQEQASLGFGRCRGEQKTKKPTSDAAAAAAGGRRGG